MNLGRAAETPVRVTVQVCECMRNLESVQALKKTQIYIYTIMTGKNSLQLVISQATVCRHFPGFPSAKSSGGLGWVGNITFLSSTIVCLNFEVVLSGFQQKVLSDQVSSSKHQSLQTFSGFLWCFCDSISLREQHLQIYNDLKEIRT